MLSIRISHICKGSVVKQSITDQPNVYNLPVQTFSAANVNGAMWTCTQCVPKNSTELKQLFQNEIILTKNARKIGTTIAKLGRQIGQTANSFGRQIHSYANQVGHTVASFGRDFGDTIDKAVHKVFRLAHQF